MMSTVENTKKTLLERQITQRATDKLLAEMQVDKSGGRNSYIALPQGKHQNPKDAQDLGNRYISCIELDKAGIAGLMSIEAKDPE